MTANVFQTENRYARAVAASKRARWDIDEDVIRGRHFDLREKFLPDGLTLATKLDFLSGTEQRFMSQVQGRTYANVFGLVERFINAKILELSQRHFLGDQVALEALVRFSDEELKHQELFRRIEALAARDMPAGYHFSPDPDAVARVVLGRSSWSVLALTCLIELFTQVHYKESIAPDAQMSALFKDVFRFHWMEESQHAVLDELEWVALDTKLTSEEREQGMSDLIELVAAVDGILRAQAAADANYFVAKAGRVFSAAEVERSAATVLEAYRYQYIHSGIERTRFTEILGSMVGETGLSRAGQALATLK
jgi:hypothetical protein